MKQNGDAGATLAAVDFGSAAVRVLVAEALENQSMRLLGIGEADSDGISEGRVVDIEKTVRSLSNAAREAEIMSRRKIKTAWAAITGENIVGVNAAGSTVIGDDSGVAMSDIKKVKQMARAEVANRSGMRVIATLERDYTLDGQGGVQKPLGMSGHKLSGEMHLVLAPENALADWEKCLLQCDMETGDQFIFAALASASAVLTEDEKKLGVCVADVGASATDAAVFYRGVAAATFCLPMASGDIHRDIAEMHHASLESAEQAKKTIGLAGDDGEFVFADGGRGRRRKQAILAGGARHHRPSRRRDFGKNCRAFAAAAIRRSAIVGGHCFGRRRRIVAGLCRGGGGEVKHAGASRTAALSGAAV